VTQHVFLPADRFVDAQHWWIGSELCRRHPSLRLAEIDIDAIGPLLAVIDVLEPLLGQIYLSRVAGIQIVDRDEFLICPPELFMEANPHRLLRRIEDAHGMGAPANTPATNATTITYRIIARVLAATLDSRYSWTLRGERPTDPPVHDDISWAGDLSGFPSLGALRRRWAVAAARESLYDGPSFNLWVLMRDLEPAALFDAYGAVHTAEGRFDLLPAYRARGGNMTLTLGDALGSALGGLQGRGRVHAPDATARG
jgi:hypothetical protein